MCALPVLVWSCLALFCGLQPHFFATSLVLTLVTDNHHFTGMSLIALSPPQSCHPQYRPSGIMILHNNLVHSPVPDHPSSFSRFLDCLLPPSIVQYCHGPHALFRVRPTHLCVMSPRLCLAWLLALHTRMNSATTPFVFSQDVLTSTN